MDEHKQIGELPPEWVCRECGAESWAFAVCKPRDEMTSEDRASAEEYGTADDQFADDEDIVLCSSCGCSHWQAPT